MQNIPWVTLYRDSLVPRPLPPGKGPGTHRLRMRRFVPRLWVHRKILCKLTIYDYVIFLFLFAYDQQMY